MRRAAVAWLSSVSFPPFLLYQWSPSEKVSLCSAGCIHGPRLWREHATDRTGLASGLGREPWLLALAPRLSLLPSPCQAAGATGALSPPVSAALGKLSACPQPAAQRGHRVQLSAVQAPWDGKRDGLMSCRKPCKPSSYGMQGHGSWEQNAMCVHTEIALTEHFHTDICISQGAGDALGTGVPMVLSWGERSCLCPQGVQ